MFRDWILAHNRTDVDSYRNLKRAIGILGMLLPIACILGGTMIAGIPVQNSISHYYHTNMRDVLVGLLGCAAIMFMTYSGYGLVDNLFTWAIGLAGAGVVVFPCPTYPQVDAAPVGIFQLAQRTSGPVHFGCAIAFFVLLAANSIFLFTISRKKVPGGRKRVRNGIYLGSGLMIVASLIVLLVAWIAARDFFENSAIALVFETVMLLAFGVAWLVKGGLRWTDDAPVERRAAGRKTSRKRR